MVLRQDPSVKPDVYLFWRDGENRPSDFEIPPLNPFAPEVPGYPYENPIRTLFSAVLVGFSDINAWCLEKKSVLSFQ
jgi:hypothetical protein